MIAGGGLFHVKIWQYWPTRLQITDFQSVLARSSSAITHSKKSSTRKRGNCVCIATYKLAMTVYKCLHGLAPT